MFSTNTTLTKRDPHKLPSALNNEQSMQDMLNGKTPAVFLDYDGCLTPIVQNPNDAILSSEMKHVLYKLANICPVAVVSGRDRQNVTDLVQLDNLFFAGSHGFDIAGPDNMHSEPGSAKEIMPELDRAEASLNELLQDVDKVFIERKRYAIAVHYRNVADEQIDTVKQVVDTVIEQYPKLKKGAGKKIIELKPNLNWHKGKAVEWLLKELNLNNPAVMPIFIGDDLTDEDAFAALQGHGITILVGEHEEQTYAEYRLEDVTEVRQFLEKLVRHASQGNTKASRH